MGAVQIKIVVTHCLLPFYIQYLSAELRTLVANTNEIGQNQENFGPPGALYVKLNIYCCHMLWGLPTFKSVAILYIQQMHFAMNVYESFSAIFETSVATVLFFIDPLGKLENLFFISQHPTSPL